MRNNEETQSFGNLLKSLALYKTPGGTEAIFRLALNRDELAYDMAADLQNLGIWKLGRLAEIRLNAATPNNAISMIQNVHNHQILKITPDEHDESNNPHLRDLSLQPIRRQIYRYYMPALEPEDAACFFITCNGRNIAVCDRNGTIIERFTEDAEHVLQTENVQRIPADLHQIFMDIFPQVVPFHDLHHLVGHDETRKAMSLLEHALGTIGHRVGIIEDNAGVLIDSRTGELFRRDGKLVPVTLDKGDTLGSGNGKPLPPDLQAFWSGAQEDASPGMKSGLVIAQVDEWAALYQLVGMEREKPGVSADDRIFAMLRGETMTRSLSESVLEGMDPGVREKYFAFKDELAAASGSYTAMLEKRGYSEDNHPLTYTPNTPTR